MRLLRFLKSVLSENDGTGSAARVALLTVITTACGIIVYHAIATKGHPDPATVLALGTFTSTISGVIYGTNKVAEKVGDLIKSRMD